MPPAPSASVPRTSTGPGGDRSRSRRMLSSFERPAAAGAPGTVPAPLRGASLSADLENCTAGANVNGYHRPGLEPGLDHRQDTKGTRWMPWHQESKKGVDGCDKPR